jgi:prophage regulatory protein
MSTPHQTQDAANKTILKRKQVEQLTGLSRSSIYRFMADNAFPKAIKLGARAVGWRASDVIQWIDSRAEVTQQGGAQ